MKASHIISIVLGVILAVVGIFLLVARGDIVLEMVGREQAMREVLFGGSSVRNAAQIVMVSGVACLAVGLLLAIFGMVLGIRKKQAAT